MIDTFRDRADAGRRLADRLGSTRGALYKTLHDARQKLRATLAAAGLEIPADGGGGR